MQQSADEYTVGMHVQNTNVNTKINGPARFIGVYQRFEFK